MTANTENASPISLTNPLGEEFSLAEICRSVCCNGSSDHYVEILIAAAVGTVIFFILGGIKRYAQSYVRNSDGLIGYRQIIGKALARTSKFFMLMVSAEIIASFTSAPFLVERIIHILFTISAVIQVAIWLREIVLGFVERKTSKDPEQHETLQNAMSLIRLLVTVILFAVASIMILDNLGVDVTGLIAGLGIGGIAIGLAAQGIFSDLFAALSIIFDKPFRAGELIQFDDTIGKIEKIGLKSTRLRSVMGEEVIISNTNLLDKRIVNFSRLDRRRTRFGIGVIYQTKPEDARRIPALLKVIVEAHDAVFIRCGFVGFGDSALNFELDFDILSSDYEVVYEGRHAIGLAIVEKFNAEGFEFAYPTQTTFSAAPDGTMVLPYREDGSGRDAGKD